MTRRLPLVVLASCLLMACGTGNETASSPEPADPAEAARTADDAPPEKRGAIVVETVSTEKYTFAKMDACGEEAWVAGPVAEFAEGDSVEMLGGMGMTEFHSDTLDRTFEKILFVDSWSVAETPIECKEAPTMDPDKPTKEFRIGTVREVMNAAGYTYARLEVCGKDVWIAAPETTVEVGSYGATPLGDEMTDFESSSLERSFETIFFVPWIKRSPQLPPC